MVTKRLCVWPTPHLMCATHTSAITKIPLNSRKKSADQELTMVRLQAHAAPPLALSYDAPLTALALCMHQLPLSLLKTAQGHPMVRWN